MRKDDVNVGQLLRPMPYSPLDYPFYRFKVLDIRRDFVICVDQNENVKVIKDRDLPFYRVVKDSPKIKSEESLGSRFFRYLKELLTND